MVFSFLLGANVLVEKVFAWPGVGSYAVEALIASDFAPVQGFVLTMAVLYVAAEPGDRPALCGRSIPARAAEHERAGPPCAARCTRGSRPRTRSPASLRAVHRFLVLLALLGPALAPYDPLASDTMRGAAGAESARHWFGTDQLGRDILSRAIVATRLDLGIAVARRWRWCSCWAGSPGWLAGFFGGWVEAVVGRLADTIMAFPLFVLAMGIVAALGNTVPNIVLATAIINFPLYARVARSGDGCCGARPGSWTAPACAGTSRHAACCCCRWLPNILPIMAVQMSLTMGYAILNAAGLSFIGLGVRPPMPEWGIMVAEGASFIVSGEWWVALFPGATLMLAVFCFNLLGDGMRDIVDPHRRRT